MGYPDDYYGYDEPPQSNLPAGQPVDVDVETMYGLALALKGENENFKPQADVVAQHFQVDESGNRSADYPMVAGLASISPSVRSALEYQDYAMTQGAQLLRDQIAGTKALANISMKIVTEFDSVDELNAADLDTVRDVTGIEPPPPPPPYTGGPYPLAV
ncbi:hypothetical protein FB566_3937 [Stackebrandtia endophytica]|uniref:Uncharacterized protein n=1 Tax=Stackebrandtia endophytica TaxID=1496996 RepID=A0A543B0K5_9ACTN|nr:hypothetical protein [Stackebrandtia endophytica]TQL78354.1 hypothetical protein FB566_3937 [Stackebrandtia endophytica]